MARTSAQSSIELAVLLSMVVIALVALSRYLQLGATGRLRSSSEGIGTVLYDPSRTQTTWTSGQISRDTLSVNGMSNSVVILGNAVSNRTETTQ